MKKKLIAILSAVGLVTPLNHEVANIDDLNSFIESEMLNKSTIRIVEIAKENEKSKSEDSLNKYIELTKSKASKLKKSDAIKVDSSELKMTSFPEDYFVSMDLDLIKKARKSEKELSNVIDNIKTKQEEHKRLEERKQEEVRKRQAAQTDGYQSNKVNSNYSKNNKSSGGSSRKPQTSGQTQRPASTQRPNIPIGVTHGAPTSSQLSASERARRENLVYSTFNRLPEASRAGVKEVRPVNKIKDGTYAGLTYWPAGTIEVALNWNDAVIIDTVIHEVGHTFHYNYGYHYSDEWEKIFAEEWAGKGYYGSINKREAFAETFKIIYSPNHSTSQARSVIPKSIDYVLSKT